MQTPKRVDFEVVEEPWATYQLRDGTVIKIKLVASEVVQTGKVDANGDPQYVVKSSNVMSVQPPSINIPE